MHPGTYIGTVGMIFAVCIGVYCFKRFGFKPATLKHQLYLLVSLQHAIVDEDVEAAPIYRSIGMVEEPRRPHKNPDLDIEQEATRPESHHEQSALLKELPIAGSLGPKAKIQGIW